MPVRKIGRNKKIKGRVQPINKRSNITIFTLILDEIRKWKANWLISLIQLMNDRKIILREGNCILEKINLGK